MHLSVIIPTCNRPEDLRRCLERLVPQVRFDAGEEVIVTDDGGTEEARQVVETFPGVRWTQGPRRGPAANRNHGVSLATGGWLVFLDDDCLPDSGWLEAYRAVIGKAPTGSAVVYYGAICGDNLPSVLWEAPRVMGPWSILPCSANFGIRLTTFRSVGGFDERYGIGVYSEDVDLAARLRAVGAEAAFVPDASVIHPMRRVPSARKMAARWEGKVIFALDQGALPPVVMLWLPWHVFRVIGSRFRGRGFGPEDGSAILRFVGELAWVCWLTPGWVAKRRKEARSAFWGRRVQECGPVPRFGF